MASSTELPQRQLAQELRFAIEDGMRSGRTSLAIRLVEENPRGWRSSHVRHNLGPERLRWLRGLLTAASGSDPDPSDDR